MSLDVYLEAGHYEEERDAIFIRRDGSMQEISREEWDQLNPDREPVTIHIGGESSQIYSANITHNLSTMAEAAGIYKYLWRPDEIGIETAKQLIEPLIEGIQRLKSDPEKYKELNPENGWGNYEGLVKFAEDSLCACTLHPDAKVRVSR